ncbi:MAG: glycosyltransferase, partial [Cyanobacteria bacterium P01_F01_bin.143]
PESDEIYRALGLALNQQNDFEQAIDCYKESLEINQEQPAWLYSSLTEMLIGNEEFQEAIAIGQLGLKFHGDFAWLNYHLAEAFFAEENWDEALTYYRKADELQSDLPGIQVKVNLVSENIQQQEREEESERLSTQAIAKHKEGAIEAAIALYLESLEINENQPDWVYSNLITLLAQANRVEQGLSFKEKALNIHAESDEIHRALGLAFNKQNDFEQAIDCYKKSLEINQEQPDWLYSSLTEMLVESEQFQEAIAIGHLGLEFHGDFAWLNYHLAEALSAEENWHEALTYYGKAKELQPDLLGIQVKINLASENSQKIDDLSLEQKSNDYQAQAVIKHKEGQTEAAIALYLKSIEINEKQADWVYGNIITLLTQDDQIELAIDIGLKAEKIYPQSDDIYRARALVFDKKKENYNAIQLYQKAFDLNPEQPDWCYLNFAQKLLEIESIRKTLEVVNKGLEYYPNYYYLNYIQAQAFAAQQRWDEAIAAYIYVQDKNPSWLEVEEKLTQTVYQKNKLERAHQIAFARQEAEKAPSFWLNSKATEQTEFVKNKDAQSTIAKSNNLDIDFLFSKVKNPEKDLLEFQSMSKVNAKSSLDLNYGCWLNSHLIYLEASVDNCVIKEDVNLLITNGHEYITTQAKFWPIAENQIIGIACFSKDSNPIINQDCRIYLNNENQLVTSNQIRLHQAYNLELIEHLKTKSDSQKNLIREKLSDFLINAVPENIREDASSLLSKLQYFLDIQPINSVGLNIPFNISIDNVISLENQSLFISGWLRDDYEMLQEIKVISSLGLSWNLVKQDILTLERQDNKNFLQNNDNFQESLGFVIYTQVPQNIYDSIAKWNGIHSFRFVVKLKGDIEIEIVPETKYEDLEAARTAVIKIAEPNKIPEKILEKCLAPTALKLQQLLMAQVKVKDLTVIGKPVEKPLVSIIIPLYRRLDFLKVQFAAIANDPTIKQQCEIIYVLDSPEQESEVSKFLSDHAKLYELPVTLIVMAKNSGYASANNIGASQAKGKYLLLLNSDVFPKTEGWALKMANFYESSPQIGVLGAKLVYEDNSLQHAGLFFEQTSCPFWNIRHYYKGLPETYELAQQNRAVPAVTGACLMIDKDLYEQVGGLSTDYIIGSFEDSDLCLKCSTKGYESWYFADATLYHLERQSIHLHPVYNQSLAWHLNSYLHNKKWGEQLSQLMECNQ